MITETALQTAREITLDIAAASFMKTELLGVSAQTVKWYRARLRLFIAALGPELPLGDITEDDLISWYKTLEARTELDPPDLSVETFHGYVRAVRCLLKWAYEKHLTITELWPVLKLPQIPEQEYKGVDDQDAIALLEVARQSSPRDYAILLFIESTGARRGGVASLKLSDLNLSEPEPFCRRVTVHEKGKRIRTVILSEEALEALRAWLTVRQSRTRFVFIDERPAHDNGLTPGGISEIIRRYKERLGITGRVSPHQWRHRRARCWLKEGMPLKLASQLLGHKTIAVTGKYYGNLLVDDLQTAYDKYYKPPK